MKALESLHQWILKSTQAQEIISSEVVQTLWSSYGQIVRVMLKGSIHHSVIVKHIDFPEQSNHPRGWNTSTSHERKVKSYKVEQEWYKNWSSRCNQQSRIPQLIASKKEQNKPCFILEDLDEVGYPLRKSSLSISETKLGLHWLAHFHATFMLEKPCGLWDEGTYWHLATRQEEWELMEKGELKQKAKWIDEQLKQCQFQTIVHGDAKVANFCFSSNMKSVAAVDFQYVGGGCGMKDVVYFLGSCLTEHKCEKAEGELLDYYIKQLTLALSTHKPHIDAQAVEKEYRRLYALAWTDFTRFLKGWMPTHQKLNGYSEKLMKEVLHQSN